MQEQSDISVNSENRWHIFEVIMKKEDRRSQKGSLRRRRKRRTKRLCACSLIALTLCAIAALIIFKMDIWNTYHSGEASKADSILYEAEETSTEDIVDSDEFRRKQETSAGQETEAEKETQEQLMDIVREMTIEQKIAQLFIITPEELTGAGQVTQAGEATREALIRYPVGGLIYFDQNLTGETQLKDMTSSVQQYAMEIEGVPLFLAIDEEGGTVARIGNNTSFSVSQFDNMSSVGATGDVEQAYLIGSKIGAYLEAYGINMNFAPVADVLTNLDNTAIGNRSFGSDPESVSQMALREAEGLRSHGIIPVMKHFPGHGATAEDTHEGFAYIDKSLEELQNVELVPFQAAVGASAECIMVAHISVPKVVGDRTPSSLSKVMITEVLRNKMGYDGLVVTDALNMGAIQNNYSSAEAAVKAILAGADLLLMPVNFQEAYQGVLWATDSGLITETRIDQSVMRILKVKKSLLS